MQKNEHYFIGVDGGGTKCHAVLFDDAGNPLGEGLGGPANVARVGMAAADAIVNACTQAVQHAGFANTQDILGNAVVSAGLAGATVSSAAKLLRQWAHPFANFHFTSDLKIAATGAHEGNNGAVLIVGTGSCAASLADGKLHQLGGHGFTFGDKGSGAWLGKTAVALTLECLDGLVDKGGVCARVCEFFGQHDTLGLVNALNNAQPSVFASFAPHVMTLAEQGDKQAVTIVEDGASYLSMIARQAIIESGGELVLTGGLTAKYISWLDKDVQSAIVAPKQSPEWGAVYCYKHS